MPSKLPTSRQLRADRYKDNSQHMERHYLRRIDKHDPDQAKARKIRSSGRWNRMRSWVLNRYPLCCDPFNIHEKEGRTIEAEEVHHIQPVADDPSKAFDADNLAPLCVQCHRKAEAKRRGGGGGYGKLFEEHKRRVKRDERVSSVSM